MVGLPDTDKERSNEARGDLKIKSLGESAFIKPLFVDAAEYSDFIQRHKQTDLSFADVRTYEGDAYLGVDCGEESTRLVLITPDAKILFSHYQTNNGQPLDVVVNKLKEMYWLMGDRINVKSSAVTGERAKLVRSALKLDFIVGERDSHYKAAAHFAPDVDFILEFGGQDLKAFPVRNGEVTELSLDEPFSCGSCVRDLTLSMGYEFEEFSRLGLFAKAPVSLDFQTEASLRDSLFQLQREGKSLEDISAGLSVSLVKSALGKLFGASALDEPWRCAVVHGSAFLNDAVLRAFEKELGVSVVRPAIAGLTGAFGAALYAKENADPFTPTSELLNPFELDRLQTLTRSTVCGGCDSACKLKILFLSDGRKFVFGNRCDKVIKNEKE